MNTANQLQNQNTHPRKLAHLKACSYMRNDDYLSALHILKEAKSTYKDHVLLLIDLASCYYMLNDFNQFKKITISAQDELLLSRSQISDITLAHASLGLGKLLEELGHIQSAYDTYKHAIRMLEKQHDRTELTNVFFRLEAQFLRLCCEYNYTNDIATGFKRCILYRIKDGDVDYEIQSALLVADISLQSMDSADQRLKLILQSENYTASEKRLILFNSIFEYLKKNIDSKNNLVPKFNLENLFNTHMQTVNYFDCDPFEKALYDICCLLTNKTPLNDVSLLRSDEMTFMSSLRYLYLIQNIDHQHTKPFKLACYKKMALLISTLPKLEKQEIIQRWQLNQNVTSHQIEISKDHIKINDEFVSTTKQSLQLIDLFKKQNSYSVDDICHNLFELELNENTFDRLRVFIRRLNMKYSAHLNNEALFLLNKSRLTLNEKVKIIKLPH